MVEIERDPERFPVVHGHLRRILLQRFPYGVYFKVYARSIRVVCRSRAPSPRCLVEARRAITGSCCRRGGSRSATGSLRSPVALLRGPAADFCASSTETINRERAE